MPDITMEGMGVVIIIQDNKVTVKVTVKATVKVTVEESVTVQAIMVQVITAVATLLKPLHQPRLMLPLPQHHKRATEPLPQHPKRDMEPLLLKVAMEHPQPCKQVTEPLNPQRVTEHLLSARTTELPRDRTELLLKPGTEVATEKVADPKR